MGSVSNIIGEHRYEYIFYAVFHNSDRRSAPPDDTGSWIDKGMTE